MYIKRLVASPRIVWVTTVLPPVNLTSLYLLSRSWIAPANRVGRECELATCARHLHGRHVLHPHARRHIGDLIYNDAPGFPYDSFYSRSVNVADATTCRVLFSKILYDVNSDWEKRCFIAVNTLVVKVHLLIVRHDLDTWPKSRRLPRTEGPVHGL